MIKKFECECGWKGEEPISYRDRIEGELIEVFEKEYADLLEIKTCPRCGQAVEEIKGGRLFACPDIFCDITAEDCIDRSLSGSCKTPCRKR